MGFGQRLVRAHHERDPFEEVLTVRAQVIPHPGGNIVRLSDVAEKFSRTVGIWTDLHVDSGPARLGPVQQLGNAAPRAGKYLAAPIADIGHNHAVWASVGQEQPHRSSSR